MVGLGETPDELAPRCATSAPPASRSSPSASTCSPPPEHLPVDRWVTPEEFAAPRVRARHCELGYFRPLRGGPLVRSYHAHEHVSPSARFVRNLGLLFDRGARVGIATHDRYLVDCAREQVRRRGLRDGYEFQTLLGVTEDLRDGLLHEGHRVRVYVPYGGDWYAYSVRRLRENPQIAVYVLKAFFRRSRGPDDDRL
jgi:hypothetical protein